MQTLSYELLPEADKKKLGLIVLQSDVTLEDEFRYYFADADISLLASRIPFENQVNAQTLKAMETHLGSTMRLFPVDAAFDTLGYACTSGALHIGSEQIAKLCKTERQITEVTDPLRAALAAFAHIGVKKIAYLAPYSQSVSQKMIDAFEAHGICVRSAATFNQSQDRLVGRIDPASIREQAIALIQSCPVDAIFIACTNIKSATVIADIEKTTATVALSSNSVLAWHMSRLASIQTNNSNKGAIWT